VEKQVLQCICSDAIAANAHSRVSWLLLCELRCSYGAVGGYNGTALTGQNIILSISPIVELILERD